MVVMRLRIRQRKGGVELPALRESVNPFYNNHLTFCLYTTSTTKKELLPPSKIAGDPWPPQYRDINPTGVTNAIPWTRPYCVDQLVRSDDPLCNILSDLYLSPPLVRSFRWDFKIRHESSSGHSPDTVTGGDKGKLKQPPLKKLPVRHNMLSFLHNLILSAVWAFSLHSSHYDANERMCYSCVEPDGESYNISDIIEEDKDAFIRNKDGIGERPGRFINKNEKINRRKS